MLPDNTPNMEEQKNGRLVKEDAYGCTVLQSSLDNLEHVYIMKFLLIKRIQVFREGGSEEFLQEIKQLHIQ